MTPIPAPPQQLTDTVLSESYVEMRESISARTLDLADETEIRQASGRPITAADLNKWMQLALDSAHALNYADEIITRSNK